MLAQVKKSVVKPNPDIDLETKRLLLYYDTKLMTFGLDGTSDLILQFPLFPHPYS